MALVEYSDSESDGNSINPKTQEETRTQMPAKRPRTAESFIQDDIDGAPLPPLPAEFRDLYTTNSRASVKDDRSLHDGRRRIIPHVEGNWPTHVYLECRLRFHVPGGIHTWMISADLLEGILQIQNCQFCPT